MTESSVQSVPHVEQHETPRSSALHVTRVIMSIVLRQQRRSDESRCTGEVCPRCLETQVAYAEYFVKRGEPVQMVIPAFPAKSPNPQKVLGHLPDQAELQALKMLQSMCDEAQEQYRPGLDLIICSDGRVFGESIGVSDEHITAYKATLSQMLQNTPCIRTYDLDDRWPGESYDRMREKLCRRYAKSLTEIRKLVKEDEDTNRLYRGLVRFLFEDTKGVSNLSNTALQARARENAYQVLLRSKGWGSLVSDVFPKAVRLSIHPQPCSRRKLGIRLGKTSDTWLTPWHSVAVENGGDFELMKRKEAEERGAKLVYVDGKPSHFRLDPVRA